VSFLGVYLRQTKPCRISNRTDR